MMLYMASRDWRTVQDKLREQGWEVTQTQRGHYRAVPPDRDKHIVHFSESTEPRSLQNAISDLRKQGLVWEDDPPAPRKPKSTSQATVIAVHETIAEVFRPEAATVVEMSDRSEKDPADLDGIFAQLKEAKGYEHLAVEHLKECESAFFRAKQALEGAKDELDIAKGRLAERKRAFDRALGVESDPYDVNGAAPRVDQVA